MSYGTTAAAARAARTTATNAIRCALHLTDRRTILDLQKLSGATHVPRPGNPGRPPSRLYNRAPALGKEKASAAAGAAQPAKRCHERAPRHEVDAHPLDPSASMRRRVG